MVDDRTLLRTLPSVDEALRQPGIRELLDGAPRWAVAKAVRDEIEDRRRAILDGRDGVGASRKRVDPQSVGRRVRELLRPAIRSVVNATGVVVHTNLGRSPLARRAVDRLVEVAGGYCNIEYDVEGGGRGSRHEHLRGIASALCGAEDAVITNNNASAVLLAVSALAAGREVVVSRGELVEIGGGFRIPEVIVQGGARLREVGTTNRTRVADYAEALGPDSAALLKVHRSNFDIVGFTEEASMVDLAELARSRGLPLIADLGSGAMIETYGSGLTGEPVVARAIAEGADVVCFSGDKLLGGPQAGVVLGRAWLVEKIREHPLMRAMRPCKLTLAALEATLELWRDGLHDEIPVAAMLGLAPEIAARRTRAFRRRVEKVMGPWWTVAVREVVGRAGGGSMPSRTLPGWAIALKSDAAEPDAIEAALRQGEPPVIGRIVEGWVILDLRTVAPAEEKVLLSRLGQVASAFGRGAPPPRDRRVS